MNRTGGANLSGAGSFRITKAIQMCADYRPPENIAIKCIQVRLECIPITDLPPLRPPPANVLHEPFANPMVYADQLHLMAQWALFT